MGHTSKSPDTDSPPVIHVRRLGIEHFEATFEPAPLEHRFAGKTAAEAIENMKGWFERLSFRMGEEAEALSKTVSRFQKALEGIEKAQGTNNVRYHYKIDSEASQN